MKKTSISEVTELLANLGIKKSDTVLVFSNAGSLGLIENETAGLVTALKSAIGPEGTLVVPTFSFSFCDGKEFDVQNTKSTCGHLTNFVLEMPEATRSVQPNHSLAAFGARVSEALKMTDKSSFGAGSAFTSLLGMDVKVLLLGVIHNTYVHYVEQQCNVEYRYNKVFEGMIRDRDRHYKDAFDMFVRKTDVAGTGTDDRKSQRDEFFATSACKSIKFGYGIHRLFAAKDFCGFMLDQLHKDPLYLVDKEKYFASLNKETHA